MIKIIAFFTISLGAILFVVTHITVQGASAPTVDSATSAMSSGGNDSSFIPLEGAAKTLYVHGTITDADGCADVATSGTITGKFYRSNHASGDACSADNNDCYVITNPYCTKTNCDGTPEDTVFNYECTAQIQYYVDSTVNGPHSGSNWTAKITATDSLSAQGSNTDTIEMETLLGLDTTPSVNYGALNLGAESAEQTLTVTNTGNSGIDVNLSVDGPMNCTTGQITPGDNRYSGTQGFSFDQATSLTIVAVGFELDLANRTNDASPIVKDIYFKLRMPTIGIGGTCSNSLIVSAAADTENGW